MAILLWLITSLIRWIRLKIYQYEVTFAVYMLTPTEKFIFNSLLLTLVTMIVTGAYIYLPDHVRAIYGHLYYYWVGERHFIPGNLPSINSVFREYAGAAAPSSASGAAAASAAASSLESFYETAKNAAATALQQQQPVVVAEL